MRREVTGMDARQALRPRRGRSARSSRSKPGAREPRSAAQGPDDRSQTFLVTFWGVCQKVTRCKSGKVIERHLGKWISSRIQKPKLQTSNFKLQSPDLRTAFR
ncbi:hypothetical protein C4Q26_24955 [Pseudomonas sp. SWI44]|nr:hypothetical protein C4Q26_24955 [Pseudomonas sp. SWI44]